MRVVRQNQILFREGQEVKNLFIVMEGEYESSRQLVKEQSQNLNNIVTLINRKDLKTRQNLIGKVLPELQNYPKNLPSTHRVYSHSIGAILGEEDIKPMLLFPEDDNQFTKSFHSSNMRCTSPTGQLLAISVENYIQLKNFEGSFKLLNEQCDRKIARQAAEDLNVKAQGVYDLNNAYDVKTDKYLSKLYRRQISNPLKAIV